LNDQNPLFDQKKQLRQYLKQKRASLTESERQSCSECITYRLFNMHEFQQAKIVFVYISWSTEVATHQIIKRLLSIGKKVLVPKIIDKETMVAQSLEDWEDLKPGTLGILTPSKGHITDETVDLAITPGLGFTERGHRIGFGAGYYDRWFSAHDVHLKVALAFENQIVDELPVEETDIPVDMILTEKRTIKI